MTNGTYDPETEAMNPPAQEKRPQMIFGEMIEARSYATNGTWDSNLKQLAEFIPDVDDEATRKTAVLMVITPTKGQWDYKYNPIVDYPDWAKTTLPSLQDLDVRAVKELQGKYVQAERIARTYKAKSSGEEKTAYAFKFVRIFPDANACLAAADAFFSGKAMPETAAPTPAAPPTPTMSKETAAKVLAAYWKNAAGNVDKFLADIAKNPTLAAYFPTDAPEVIALISQ
jgi:hypothetical protein